MWRPMWWKCLKVDRWPMWSFTAKTSHRSPIHFQKKNKIILCFPLQNSWEDSIVFHQGSCQSLIDPHRSWQSWEFLLLKPMKGGETPSQTRMNSVWKTTARQFTEIMFKETNHFKKNKLLWEAANRGLNLLFSGISLRHQSCGATTL